MDIALFSREIGLESDDIVEKYMRYRMAYSIGLSDNVEVVQDSPVPTTNSIALEQSNGKLMISGTHNGRIDIYDLYPKQCATEHYRVISICSQIERAHENSISEVRWYPFDDGMFTSCSNHIVRVWDAEHLDDVCDFTLGVKIYCHAFSPVAKAHTLIACICLINIFLIEGATSDPQVRLCDLNSGAATHVLSGHQDSVLSVSWSPKEEHVLASGSFDHTIKFWDIRQARSSLMTLDMTNTSIKASDPSSVGTSSTNTFSHKGSINGLVFSDDGFTLISAGTDSKIRVWDTFSGKNHVVNFGSTVKNKLNVFKTMALTPIYNRAYQPLLFFPNDSNDIGVYRLWDGQLVKQLQGHLKKVSSIAYHPSHEELYSAGHDMEILNWSAGDLSSDDDAEAVVATEKRPREEDEWSD